MIEQDGLCPFRLDTNKNSLPNSRVPSRLLGPGNLRSWGVQRLYPCFPVYVKQAGEGLEGL
jgi:hypothetical protein